MSQTALPPPLHKHEQFQLLLTGFLIGMLVTLFLMYFGNRIHQHVPPEGRPRPAKAEPIHFFHVYRAGRQPPYHPHPAAGKRLVNAPF